MESPDGGCAEAAWIWVGSECTFVCACDSSDCGELYEDYQSCKSANEASLPNACRPQDARSSGAQCGTIEGYSFNGYTCETIICGCIGDDCSELSDSVEQCESRFQICMDRVPECFDERFPVVSPESEAEPGYPEYTFSVEGYDELYDAQSGTVAVFAEWTRAQWGGWEAVGAPEMEICPSVPALHASFHCPRPRPLVLRVGELTYRVNVSLLWNSVWLNLGSLAEPADVDVRIAAHASGSLVFQIRDAATELPVVMVVQSLPDVSAEDRAWEFPPFTFTRGEKLCQTDPGECNWTYSPLNLEISTSDAEWVAESLSIVSLQTTEANYTVLHGYFFEQFSAGSVGCTAEYAPRRSFALLQR